MPIPLGILAVAGAGAGGGGAAYDLLETTILSSSASSVTFSSLGSYSDYKHLQVRAVVRMQASGSNTNADLLLRFNGDTASNYNWHELKGDGSSVISDAYTSNSSIGCGYVVPIFGTQTDYQFGATVIDILDFSNSSKNTTIRALCGAKSFSDSDVALRSGAWRNTNAVTSMVFLANQNFVSGCRFSLYGLK